METQAAHHQARRKKMKEKENHKINVNCVDRHHSTEDARFAEKKDMDTEYAQNEEDHSTIDHQTTKERSEEKMEGRVERGKEG